MNVPTRPAAPPITDARRTALLHQIEKKLLWLSAWMIHNANHLRANRDGLKVGGHQASCASVISIMTALYFEVLRPQDRVAVKPHAGPVFHAINYLFGRQTVEKMAALRSFGGAQSYPSRVKDGAEVDFSTGSVGLGVAMTSFSALMADYVRLHGLAREDLPPGRQIAIAGDAELDEGNIYEALLEGWKHDVRNVWWIIDYNRQSLDSVVPDRLFGRIEGLFRDMGWDVVMLKYGRRLQAAFAREDGEALRRWIDDCPNSLYSALTFQGGAAWRQVLLADLGRSRGVRAIIDPLSDDELAELMTNLGGHDLEFIIEQLRAADAAGDQPTCFIAYTIKGMGLPFAGHKDNHAGLMSKEQMETFHSVMNIRAGHEWDRFEGLEAGTDEFSEFLSTVPFATPLTAEGRTRCRRRTVAVPAASPMPKVEWTEVFYPVGVRGHPGGDRTRPGRAEGTRRAHRYDQPGCHGLHQSRAVGESARRVRPAHAQRRISRCQAGERAALGHGAGGAAHRAWHSRAEPVSILGAAGLAHSGCTGKAAADRDGLRSVRQPWARCADLCLLPGRAVLAGLDALGADAGARGRAAPEHQYPADRHQQRSPGEL